MLKSLLSTFTHTYVDGKTNLNKPFSNKTMDRPFTDVVELACSICIEKIQLSFLMPFLSHIPCTIFGKRISIW